MRSLSLATPVLLADGHRTTTVLLAVGTEPSYPAPTAPDPDHPGWPVSAAPLLGSAPAAPSPDRQSGMGRT